MRWKLEGAKRESTRIRDERRSWPERIRLDLERRGVGHELSQTLSTALEDQVLRCDGPAYESLLDGVAVACAVQNQTGEDLTKNACELQEIERLMNGFVEELSKLDEILEVLAAHVRRMRTRSPEEGDPLIH